MKTAYIQPQTEIVNVKLFGSMMEDESLPANSYGNTAGEGEFGARQQSNIFEEDEEEDLQVWNAGYTSSKLWLE